VIEIIKGANKIGHVREEQITVKGDSKEKEKNKYY
jgi:hypothetical protein